jgi:hypothetical protein
LPDRRAPETGPVERLLVNFLYAHPVGHAIEALHYANGYHAADPELEIAVAHNAATPVELASFCPFLSAAYAIEQPLLEQLVLDALAVATPWLTISGGRWFEYCFNHVPFRSIIPDTERYPSAIQFAPEPSAASMSEPRIGEDLDRIVFAAGELIGGTLSYEQALRDYFADLLAAHGGDASAIWSIDGVHTAYVS